MHLICGLTPRTRPTSSLTTSLRVWMVWSVRGSRVKIRSLRPDWLMESAGCICCDRLAFHSPIDCALFRRYGLPLEEARLHHDPILHKQVQPTAVELRRVRGRT